MQVGIYSSDYFLSLFCVIDNELARTKQANGNAQNINIRIFAVLFARKHMLTEVKKQVISMSRTPLL